MLHGTKFWWFKFCTGVPERVKRKINKNTRVWATSEAEASKIFSKMQQEQGDSDEPNCFEDFFDQIWKTPSLIKLPTKAWAVHKMPNVPPVPKKDHVISFTEMTPTPDDNIRVKKKIVINRTASIEFYVNDYLIDDGMFFMPEIGTVTELQFYLDDFHANY